MLLSNERYRPCNALCLFCSVGRVTTILPSSSLTVMALSTCCDNSPFGPFTVTTFLSDTDTDTPVGRAIGAFPILDIFLRVFYLINKRNIKPHHRRSVHGLLYLSSHL